MSRDNFTITTKNLLRDRAGNRCSNPHCNRLTVGPGSDPLRAINMGTAAHICAAAKGGPRYDDTMTPPERKSPDNGIWLCNFCADLIDKDSKRYTVSLLHQWKEEAEKNAEFQIHGMREIYTANNQYVNNFCDTLFLHKNQPESRVNLKNLFVMPGYIDLQNCNGDSKIKTDLKDKIKSFIEGKKRMLFISGSGGLGKTTLVSWMNYHYVANDEVGCEVFGERPVITVRLRDLDKQLISENKSLVPALRKYMQINSIEELEQKYPNAVLILDGFDELCMIEDINNPSELIYDLSRKRIANYKYIFTSRPQYIDKGIDIPNEYIAIQHFDIQQVNEWIEHYTSSDYCGEKIDQKILDYLLSMDESSFSTICDTPMNLYMLVSKKADSLLVNNNWALYKHIFYNEMSETEYNMMFPNPDRKYEHDIIRLRDVLYQISEEIAYKMYKSHNAKLFINESELNDIINELSKSNQILRNANMKEISAQCYALCCYWKENADRGAVEFLHNDIRDFFLAEKIYREMEKLFGHEEENNSKNSIEETLCEFFKYGVLDTKVTEFLLLRSMYNYSNGIQDFTGFEYKRASYCNIISKMTSDCSVFKHVMQKEERITPLDVIVNSITCIIQVFRHVLDPYCVEKKHYLNIGDWKCYDYWFKSAFNQVPVTLTSDSMLTLASNWDFSSINLKGLDLRNIGFCHSILCNSELSNTILSGCDFTDCNLTGSTFIDADIHYACLQNTHLENCDFSGADLRGTELPDGFCSTNQKEQVEHLKRLGIRGLKINR